MYMKERKTCSEMKERIIQYERFIQYARIEYIRAVMSNGRRKIGRKGVFSTITSHKQTEPNRETRYARKNPREGRGGLE